MIRIAKDGALLVDEPQVRFPRWFHIMTIFLGLGITFIKTWWHCHNHCIFILKWPQVLSKMMDFHQTCIMEITISAIHTTLDLNFQGFISFNFYWPTANFDWPGWRTMHLGLRANGYPQTVHIPCLIKFPHTKWTFPPKQTSELLIGHNMTASVQCFHIILIMMSCQLSHWPLGDEVILHVYFQTHSTNWYFEQFMWNWS